MTFFKNTMIGSIIFILFVFVLMACPLFGHELLISIKGGLESPPQFALGDLQSALTAKGITFSFLKNKAAEVDGYLIEIISPDENTAQNWEKPESFRISVQDKKTSVAGSDAVGLMYGIFALTEQIKFAPGRGEAVLENIHAAFDEPALQIRADNPFITVETKRAGISKWFYDEQYWQNYFAMLARNRYNLCDIHAMYRFPLTNFPNLLPFFIKYPAMPEAIWPEENQERNLAMLKRIVDIAEDHGVHVSLMNYSADIPNVNMGDEKKMVEYISWAIAELLRRVPKLWMFGFRIGESGKSADFFEKSYIDGVAKSGRKDIRLYTRHWLANFRSLSKIGMKYPGHFYLEIKYNGEHLAAPYHALCAFEEAEFYPDIWRDNSYGEFLNYPRYWQIIWQIRSNGTHRLFPWNDAEFARRTMRSCTFGKAIGFTMEPITAYFHQEPERVFKNSQEADYMRYMPERYWSWYLTWGRLGYDPNTPDSVFVNTFIEHYGAEAGRKIYRLTTTASRVVPLIFRHHAHGPDHRLMAPEFETGNAIVDSYHRNDKIYDIDYFARSPVLDRHVYLNCADYVQARLSESVNGKITPLMAAQEFDQLADQIFELLEGTEASKSKKEWRHVKTDVEALAWLARYYAEKDRAAVALQFYYKTDDVSQLVKAERCVLRATDYWKKLAATAEAQYKPIYDPLRTGEAFTWSDQLPDLQADLTRVREVIREAGDSRALKSGYVPTFRTRPYVNLPLVLGTTASVKAEVQLHYTVGADKAQTVSLTPTEKWTWQAVVPGDRLHEGNVLNYWFTVNDGSQKMTVPENGKKQPYRTFITCDDQGPDVAWNEAGIVIDKEHGVAHVEAVVTDASGVDSVRAAWKLLPGTVEWRKPIPMQRRFESHTFYADIPLTYEGILYSVVATDCYGNATRFPDSRLQTPYRVVEPWDRGLPPEMRIASYGKLDGAKVRIVEWQEISKMGRPGRFYEYSGNGRVRFTFNVDKYSDYQLTIGKAVSRDYGAAKIFIDDRPVGVLTCTRDVGSILPAFEDFYVPALAAGEHMLTLQLTGDGKIGVEGYKIVDQPAQVKAFVISQSFPGYPREKGRDMYPIGRTDLQWKEAEIGDRSIVRLDKQLDPHENCYAYAATEIVCDKDIETTLRIGHNDGVYVWLNGKIVYEYPDKHAFEYNMAAVPIKLKKGKNLLVLLMMQAGRNWMFNVNLDTYDFRTQLPEFEK